MAYQNFIPTVWNEGIERELERLCVFAEDCNRKYEGSVKEKGESVKILGVGKPTIKSLAKANRNNDIDSPEEIISSAMKISLPSTALPRYSCATIGFLPFTTCE